MILLRWLTFLLKSLTAALTVLLFWIYLYLLMLVFVLQWLSLHWEILIMLLSQFPLTSHQNQNGMPCFILRLMTTCADWDSLHDQLRDVPWEDLFKLSATASEFCK